MVKFRYSGENYGRGLNFASIGDFVDLFLTESICKKVIQSMRLNIRLIDRAAHERSKAPLTALIGPLDDKISAADSVNNYVISSQHVGDCIDE